MKDEDCEDRTQEQLASLKRSMRKTLEDATVRAMHKVMADFEAKSDQRLMEMPEKQDEFVAPGGGYVPAIPLPQPPTWHHPDCEGECIACLIEREVTAAYGTQGLAYLRRHIAVTQPPEQEPVAWKDRTYGNLHHQDFGNSIPLYTSPPASKPWVGLTDVERIELMEKTHPKNRWPLLALCEDKLREKNA